MSEQPGAGALRATDEDGGIGKRDDLAGRIFGDTGEQTTREPVGAADANEDARAAGADADRDVSGAATRDTDPVPTGLDDAVEDAKRSGADT
jgi:hypothetical protein